MPGTRICGLVGLWPCFGSPSAVWHDIYKGRDERGVRPWRQSPLPCSSEPRKSAWFVGADSSAIYGPARRSWSAALISYQARDGPSTARGPDALAGSGIQRPRATSDERPLQRDSFHYQARNQCLVGQRQERTFGFYFVACRYSFCFVCGNAQPSISYYTLSRVPIAHWPPFSYISSLPLQAYLPALTSYLLSCFPTFSPHSPSTARHNVPVYLSIAYSFLPSYPLRFAPRACLVVDL